MTNFLENHHTRSAATHMNVVPMAEELEPICGVRHTPRFARQSKTSNRPGKPYRKILVPWPLLLSLKMKPFRADRHMVQYLHRQLLCQALILTIPVAYSESCGKKPRKNQNATMRKILVRISQWSLKTRFQMPFFPVSNLQTMNQRTPCSTLLNSY